ncbi:hypothetical protein [Aeromonas sobria]|nr:hypothetical protein [Aeromonas sobria]
MATLFVPLIYGLEEYGTFLRLALISFILHRVIDIMNEPLIVTSNKDDIFGITIKNGIVVSFFSLLVVFFFDIKGLDFALLVSLFFSSSYITFLYKNNDNRLIIYYYFTYLSVFAFVMSLSSLELYSMTVSQFYQVVTWASVVISICFFAKPVFSPSKIRLNLHGNQENIIHLIGFSFSNIFLSYLFLYLMMDYMNDKELGALRVALALVQAAIICYPINLKFIQMDFIKIGDERLYYHLVFSSIFFIGGCTLLSYVVSLDLRVLKRMQDYISVMDIKLLVSITPIVFLSYLLERYCSAKGKIKYILASLVLSYVPFFVILVYAPNIISENWAGGVMMVLSVYTLLISLLSKCKYMLHVIMNITCLNIFYITGQREILILLLIYYLFIAVRNRRKQ